MAIRAQCERRLHVHRLQRLTVLHRRLIPCGAAHDDEFQDEVHFLLQLFVNERFVRLREVREMNAFLGTSVHGTDDVLPDRFRHERNERRGDERRRLQCGVEGHVGIDLILLHALRPVTLSSAADVPVRQVVRELFEQCRGFRDPVGREILVDALHHRVHLRKKPAVHDRQFRIVQLIFRRIEAVDVRIERIECISVPKRAEELPLSLLHRLVGIAFRQPRRAGGVEVPADRVGAVLLEFAHRIDRIAERFRHLPAEFVLHEAHDDDVLERGTVKEQRRFRVQ